VSFSAFTIWISRRYTQVPQSQKRRHSGMDRRNPDCMDASKPRIPLQGCESIRVWKFTLALLLFNVAPLREEKNASSKQTGHVRRQGMQKRSHATAQRRNVKAVLWLEYFHRLGASCKPRFGNRPKFVGAGSKPALVAGRLSGGFGTRPCG